MPISIYRPLIERLPDRHRRALEWFDDHAGAVVPWPGGLEDGTLLATKAKGIYKPEWSDYALSVRQSLDGPYPDREVERRRDGTWMYAYHQETFDLERTDDLYTNRGLLECLRDVVPLGVFIQVKGKPNPRYRVLGLALIGGYDQGVFYLEGSDAAFVHDQSVTTMSADPRERADSIAGVFTLAGVEDARRRTLRLIAERRGQAGFRRTLLDAYGHRCAMTGYDADDALEAAHISPYRGPVTHHPSNGLLLRGDIHTLFDLGMIAVHFDERRILLSRDLLGTEYGDLHDEELRFPQDVRLYPSREALEVHRERSGL